MYEIQMEQIEEYSMAHIFAFLDGGSLGRRLRVFVRIAGQTRKVQSRGSIERLAVYAYVRIIITHRSCSYSYMLALTVTDCVCYTQCHIG